MRSLNFPLSTGQLSLELYNEVVPFETIVDVAERINPKRSFIFASKITGRYIPTSASSMQWYANTLADLIPIQDLKGKVSLLSLSETALGLGEHVHLFFKDSVDILKVSTTRHLRYSPLLASFKESHSHLPTHYIYKSFDENVNQHFLDTDTLILVDDEITTGSTLQNLFKSIPFNKVSNIIILSLTDWSNNIELNFEGVPVKRYSLISGKYTWTQNKEASLLSLPYNSDCKNLSYIDNQNYNYLPSFATISNINPCPSEYILFGSFRPVRTRVDRTRANLHIYCNELLPSSFNFSNSISGLTPYFLALSSSPILLNDSCIQDVIEFPGFYDKDIPLYLYNFKSFISNLTDTIQVNIITEWKDEKFYEIVKTELRKIAIELGKNLTIRNFIPHFGTYNEFSNNSLF